MASKPIVPFEHDPDLRAYPWMEKVPAHCSVFLVADHRLGPIVHRGECVVIDHSDREPAHEELFLMQWNSGTRREICATWNPPVREGSPVSGHFYAGQMRATPVVGLRGETLFDGRAIRWGDGPYRSEHLSEKIVGRVVGLGDGRLAVDALGLGEFA